VNYLLFHSLVELFSIIVAATVFIITWNSIKYIKNPYLIMVGVSYLFIGILDLLHTLSYKGMPIFTDYDFYANQLWIAARGLESCTLLAAFLVLFSHKSVKAGIIFIFYSLVTTLLVASIFYWKIFPICFVAGKGLTAFKVYSEYAICAILVASIVLMIRSRSLFVEPVYKLLLLSMIFTIISELAFTFYIDNFGILNIVGHYFKLFSFMMIYRAIVATGIEEPYHLIFNELNRSNEELQKEIDSRIITEAKLESEIEERKHAELALEGVLDELETMVVIRTGELERTREKLALQNEELQNSYNLLKEETAERLQTVETLCKKEQLLLHQSRQAAMGEMIGNIAHQWRQPLNTLGLYMQRLALFYDTPNFNKEFMDASIAKSMEIITHMSKTIDDFRDYFKPEKEKTDFYVIETIKNTLSLIEGNFQNPKIGIDIIKDGNPVINGFQNEFSQVILNILNNARDAMIEKEIADGKVMISIFSKENRTVITVADNAGGIPEDIINKVFDPYFTTKGPQLGTGIGLFMSKAIVEKNMGGRISVRNTEIGAEFRIEM
jgi:signal transduction histidine kinase